VSLVYIALFLCFFCVCFNLNLKAPKHSLPANTHTHRTSTQHTAHAQKAPTLFMGRYHYPLPETAAVQSVGLPWLLARQRASSVEPSMREKWKLE